jgi:hypothetical protein
VKAAILSLLLLVGAATASDMETYEPRLVTNEQGLWYRVRVPERCEFVFLESTACMYRVHDLWKFPVQLQTPGWTIYDTRTGKVTANASAPRTGRSMWTGRAP